MTTRAVELDTERFQLRELVAADVSETYLSWFNNEDVQDFIYAARENQTLEKLKIYVTEKLDSTECLFLGIFNAGRHIGNLKFEPLDTEAGVAVMGIMVGDPNWRGRGVAGEVIGAGAEYLHRTCKIHTMQLGVDSSNVSAVRAYEKLGFKEVASCSHIAPDPDITVMSWHLKS